MIEDKKVAVSFSIGLLYMFSCEAMLPQSGGSTDSSGKKELMRSLEDSATSDASGDRPERRRRRRHHHYQQTSDNEESSASSRRPSRYQQASDDDEYSTSFSLFNRRLRVPNVENKLPSDVKVILSIDGGGSRGIVPAFILKTLGADVKRRLCSMGTQKDQIDSFNLSECFDIVAGTSVGALVGASLLLGKEREVYENFEEYASEIFQKRVQKKLNVLASPTYKKSGRKAVIERVIENENMLGGEIKGHFVVPFYCYNTREARVYQNFGEDFHDFNLVDILMMTSAAPTYFPPHHCESVTSGNEFSGGDGGIFANNPSREVYDLVRDEIYPDDPIVLISLGTGTGSSGTSVHHFDKLNLLQWATAYPSIAIDAASDNCHRGMVRKSKQSRSQLTYYRFQFSLREEETEMDNTNPEIFESIVSTVRTAINPHGYHGGDYADVLNILTEVAKRKILSQSRLRADSLLASPAPDSM
ncbi:MAG: patatin-like phospholipase family protein [Holosporaceae bacterium]|jgi:predicted acylesterase/phospholipase RssA|nr:patatin-like phospholipase family protein [Holosporaceae bacterium]